VSVQQISETGHIAYTGYPHVNALLDRLLAEEQTILDTKLCGLYLTGSLVIGDFDDDTSDADLVAVLSGDLDEAEFKALDTMHHRIVHDYPQWEHRIEILYVSRLALDTFRTRRSDIGVISPGEPFHYRDAGEDWLMNWYLVRTRGITVFGPPPQTVMPEISKQEFIEAVKAHAVAWREYWREDASRPLQAYAILTLCRALYTATTGEQPSKRQAALWTASKFPQWAQLLQNALQWRKAWREPNVEHAATRAEARTFIFDLIEQIERLDMADAKYPQREALLKTIETGWNEFHAYLKALSLEQLTTPKDAVGWTVKDHVVHLAIWEGATAAMLRKKSRLEYMQVDQATWDTGDFDKQNAVLEKRYKETPLSEVLRMFEDAHHDMLTAIEALSDADLMRPIKDYEQGSTRENPITDSIAGNTFDHYAEHKPWIEAIVAQVK